jgi:pilus assembly protein TadC
MDTETNLIEPLLEKVEQYSKITFELIKLKSVDKTADIASRLFSRLLLTGILCLFTLTLNIATALWLGSMLGKNYYGFFIVASFYALIGIVILFIHPLIKASVNNAIIEKMLN